MKTLKVLLPSIALIVVLTLSITIGVYAATDVTFSVTGSIVYISPDVDVAIYGYIGEAVGNSDYEYSESSRSWSLEDNQLAFTRKNNAYQPAIITFKVYNNTSLPVFCYFTNKVDGEDKVMTTDTLYGVTQTDKALVEVSVEVDESIEANGIPAYSGEGEIPYAEVVLKFTLIESATLIEDKVEFKDYTFKVSKTSAITE